MRIDLGGIAKGDILQAALTTLRDAGVGVALVDAGGDIVAGDAPPGQAGWRLGVPETTSEVVLPVGTQNDLRGRFVYIANAALATSGPAAQFVQIDGVRYSHVVDPRTGWALTTSVTAHVIAADGATADALATAATVAGARGLDAIRARFPEARIYLVESVGGTAAVR